MLLVYRCLNDGASRSVSPQTRGAAMCLGGTGEIERECRDAGFAGEGERHLRRSREMRFWTGQGSPLHQRRSMTDPGDHLIYRATVD